MGGDCLNVGCVPSKALIRSARAVFDVSDAGRFGVRLAFAGPGRFPGGYGTSAQATRRPQPDDSAQRFTKLGVDVFLGEARFSVRIRFKSPEKLYGSNAQLSRPGPARIDPPIPGLAEAGFLTNETVFNLTQCPPRLAVIGGGPIGCELAQAFQRLGSQVSVLHKNAHLLDREDMEAAAIVQKAFIREGITVFLNAKIIRVERNGGAKLIFYESQGKEQSVAVDEILVGTGRAPNVEGLNLETVGVQYDQRKGVLVNDCLQTTNPRIYAAGDVCMARKFTHGADFTARIVIQNALFLGRKKASALPCRGALTPIRRWPTSVFTNATPASVAWKWTLTCASLRTWTARFWTVRKMVL